MAAADGPEEEGLSLAALRRELEQAEIDAGAASMLPDGPVAAGTMHLWPLPGPPQSFSARAASRKSDRPLYTEGVSVPEEADVDISAVLNTRTNAGVYVDKLLLLRGLEDKWSFKARDQDGDLQDAAVDKDEEWQRAVASLFSVDSSDDSDAVDPDYDTEWRPETAQIFAACRTLQLEPHSSKAVDGFVTMLEETAELEATSTERHLVWDAVRFLYRDAEPVHDKQWLSQCSRLADGGSFAHRPSLAAFLHAVKAAAVWPSLGTRHRRKAQRWADRVMLLFHKRAAALREFGAAEPTWAQIHVAPEARPETVPSVLLHHTVDRATSLARRESQQSAEREPASPGKQIKAPSRCPGNHFPCDRSPARPHSLPP
eukprot:TRINITY_DN11848_c0_g1_i1.p1 TRINITY_DN11848_c0_g1~~TRINITY_DN11848_c0_g1_i1.p1  ORF type:complete len:389 (+),score=96.84 TRINITY_DN11848_c0_g1_i1:53-1168(+)